MWLTLPGCVPVPRPMALFQLMMYPERLKVSGREEVRSVFRES